MTAAMLIDEAALVRRVREHAADRDVAFAQLFEAYRVRVFTICRHLVRTRADAEDATQEVFVALFRALPGFRGESSLATFIHRIAVRIGIKHGLRSSRHGSVPIDEATAAAPDPLEAREDQRRMWAAMDQLSLEHRGVLVLFTIDGLSHREIATILGIPEGTVWSRLHLARKRLAQLLA
jgi:RNA polymerase sigma-70 factor (ECF subfamily)